MVKRAALLFLTLGLAPAVPAYPGNGTDAVPYMKVDAGARAAGMGGAFAAVADDASAIFHNPAGLAFAERKEIMLSHAEWLQGIRNEYLSYVHTTGTDWAFGGGASMLFSGAMTRYDRDGLTTGSYTENEGFVTLGAAHALGEYFSFGLAGKIVYQKADSENATAYAADAGLLYHGDYWRFALAMENVGSRLRLYREEFRLPEGYKAAAAWRALDSAWVTAQVTHRPVGGVSAAVGAEYQLAVHDEDTVAARAGYMSGPGSEAGSGFALGLGLANSDLKFDYAFTPFGALGNVHRFTFSARFGADKETLRMRAARGNPYKRYIPRENTWREQKKQLEQQPKKKAPVKKAPAKKERRSGSFTW